jgi:hypothetical protein
VQYHSVDIVVQELNEHTHTYIYIFIFLKRPARYAEAIAQRGLWPPRTTRFRDHTQRRATVGRTPLDE